MFLLRQAHEKYRRSELYKFKSLQGENFDHTIEIVREHRIFCPRPSQLNDPLECKPTLTIGDISDTAYRLKVDEWVRRCVTGHNPMPTEAEIQAELTGLTQERLNTLVSEATLEYSKAVDERYRIISLTASYFNVHLWQNYADNYRGVCLGFYVDPEWGSAYEVNYSDDVRALELTENSDRNHLIQSALIKRREWMEEKEYRLIYAEPPVGDGPRLMGQKYEFGPDILRSMIFGHSIDAGKKRALIDAAENQEKLKCFDAVLNDKGEIVLRKTNK